MRRFLCKSGFREYHISSSRGLDFDQTSLPFCVLFVDDMIPFIMRSQANKYGSRWPLFIFSENDYSVTLRTAGFRFRRHSCS